MKNRITPAQWGASAFALGLLALQVLGALEYTDGASLHTRAVTVAVMLTLAGLPIFIEACRRTGAGILALVLGIGFACYLLFSMSATIGRVGEPGEVRAKLARGSGQAAAETRQDVRDAKARVAQAETLLHKCAGRTNADCEAAVVALNTAQEKLDKLQGRQDKIETRVGDVGADTIAWLMQSAGVPADAVRRVTMLAYVFGTDILIWALVWFASSHKVRIGSLPADEQPLPRDLTTDERHVLAALRTMGGVAYTQKSLGDTMSVGEAEAHRRVTQCRPHVVRREVHGRRRVIRMAS